MEFYCKTIPHEHQRYETVGDYELKGGVWNITVSDMGNDNYAFLVMMHELTELYLTQKRGITEESISDFDKQYERFRPIGDISEPGDSPNAPYRKEHRFAENIERQLAHEIGVDWAEYDKTVCNL